MSRTSRAGSHAGRGFRFQDAIGVWLAVRSWAGDLPYGSVIPEGRDDYEILGSANSALVQVKSRRDHLGLFPISDVVEFVRALWLRAESCSSVNDDLILILERGIVGGLLVDHTLEDHKGLAKVLRKDPLWTLFASRTCVWIVSEPFETAVTIISQTMPCSPLASQVYYGELLSKICYLADANGLIKNEDFEGLAISDVETSVRRLEPILDQVGMEVALRDGYCDAVDFISPVYDVNFYQGIDARPGHLAAGLIVERPEICREVISILESHGSALIAGPSGAGKSALMWEAARATRHTSRWFEIKRGDSADSYLFIRLARTLRASSSAPIGFVLDDIGRGFNSLWDALAKEANRENGILLLGSIREEDVFMLSSRSHAREIRPVMNEALAETIWKKLKDQEQTTWPGWQEPWIRSDKLLLEYAHILTRGDRLEVILREQVDRRLRESRDTELSVLRVISLAGAAGALIDVEQMRDVLDINSSDLSRALRRLIDEHLIAEPVDGWIRGLHQLRSKTLFNLCHAFPPHTPSRSVGEAVQAAKDTSLEALAIYVTVNLPATRDVLLQALAFRLERDHDPIVAAAIFTGLGQAHIETTLQLWVADALAQGLEPTQITSAVLLVMADTDITSLPFSDRLNEACSLLQTRSASDPRLSLISLLSESCINACISDATPTQLRALLSSLLGVEIPQKIKMALATARPDFDYLTLDLAAELLSTVMLIDPEIAMGWADNQTERLLARVPAEIPWADSVKVEIAPEGRLLRSSIFNVAHSVQTNAHDDVVHLCECLFGLDPAASVVAVDAIGADGLPAGYLDYQTATKRIPRENLPSSSLPKWNRKWISTAARLVGAESYSDYLERAYALLEELVAVLERVVDTTLRGKVPPPIILTRFGNIHLAARELTSPSEEFLVGSEQQYFGTSIQNLLFSCSADLIRRFLEFPEQTGAYVAWTTDLLNTVNKTRLEPWEIIRSNPETFLLRLESVIKALRLISVEAGVQDIKPVSLLKQKVKNSSRGNALRMAEIYVEEKLRQRSNKYFSKVQSELQGSNPELEVHVRSNWDYLLPWPNLEILLIVDLELPADWPTWLSENSSIVRSVVGELRKIWIVPRVLGFMISRLTVCGVDTLFNSPYSIDDWLDELLLTRLNDFFSREAEVIVGYITELDGLSQFNLGVKERHPDEKTVLETTKKKLSEALLRFETQSEGSVIQPLLRQLSEDVENKHIALAECIAILSHGQLTTGIEVLMNISDAIVLQDLIVDLHTSALRFE